MVIVIKVHILYIGLTFCVLLLYILWASKNLWRGFISNYATILKTFTSRKILYTSFFLTQHLTPTDSNTVSLALHVPKCNAGEIKWHVEVLGQNLAFSYFSLCCFALPLSDEKGFWTLLHIFISLVYIFTMRY